MNNSTQTFFEAKKSFKGFVAAFGLLLVFLLGSASYGQNGLIGAGFGANDWSTTSTFIGSAGNSRIFTSTANGTGNQYFRLNINWASNYSQFGPSSTSNDYTITTGTEVPSSELVLNNTTKAYFINVTSTSDNYIFKTKEGNNPPTNKGLIVFRVQGTVRNVSTVIQSPVAANVPAGSATIVTASLDGTLATGQAVYLRYTANAYSSSTVVQMTGSGTTYTAAIPSGTNTLGANVSYYVFTSGTANVASDGSNADLYTINLNSNSGSNYSYTVISNITTWTTAWSNGTPDLNREVIIDGTYTASGDLTAKKLTVNSGRSLTVATGTNLTVTNEVINKGSFVIENNANLIQSGTTNNNIGDITVKRNSNPLHRLDYTMWSSPVVNATRYLTDFSPLTSNVSPDNIRFYNYNSSNDKYAAILNASATPFALGIGYLIRMPNTDPTTDYDTGTATLAFPGIFTGIPNNGDINVTGTATKYAAVGNPYPSTISADAFIDANVTASGTLYYWRKTNIIGGGGTSYATYTKAGGIANGGFTPTSDIAIGQGFITTVPTGNKIAFTNAMRTLNSSAQFMRTKAPTQKNRVWINLSAGINPVNQMLVAYLDGATTGVDNGIDGKYINDSKTALTSNINGEEYVIQGRPAFDASDVVALNFKAEVAGDFTIAKDHADGLFANGQAIYLVDAATGTETNLQTDAYTFTAAAGASNARFSLKYQKTLNVNTVAFDENAISVYKQNGVLGINAGNTIMKNVKVFDIQGRLILEQKEVNATTTTLKNLVAGKQAVLIQITSDDNRVVTKKAIN